MAATDILIATPPARVFAVLADADRYADWVVGAQAVRDADEEWPERDARLRHSSGIRPLVIHDETTVVESHPPSRLVLDARVAPFGTWRIELSLVETAGGTHVTMTENPVDGLAAAADTAVADAALHARNVFSLRRLKALAEDA